MIRELLGLNEKWVLFRRIRVKQIYQVRHFIQSIHKCLHHRDVIVDNLVIKRATDLNEHPDEVSAQQHSQVTSIFDKLHKDGHRLKQLYIDGSLIKCQYPGQIDQQDIRCHQ